MWCIVAGLFGNLRRVFFFEFNTSLVDTWPWVSTILTIDMLISKGLNIFITHYPVWHVDFAWQGASVLKYEWICL